MAFAYVQPSRRPTDGRYGETQNRLQHYYQFQVVIKPSPDNIQELYLGSLEMLGLIQHKTTSVLLKITGKTNLRCLGFRLGSLVKRYGSDPIYLFPTSGRLRM